METEKNNLAAFAPKLLFGSAVLLMIWIVFSVNRTQTGTTDTVSDAYEQVPVTELPDPCQAPEGYTDAEWRDHMSHHPSQYPDCFSDDAPNQLAYLDISTDELAMMLAEADSDLVLIDVHTPEQAHIPGTDAFIPFDTIADRADTLPEALDTRIVVYCRSGSMSSVAAETLIRLGYRYVYNLDGGTNAWTTSGREVIEEAR